jgi:D-ribose pyranase
MKLKGILNRKLNEVLASMGHGQMLIVCDAGFPIPKDAWYVDLAITKDLPDLPTVLELISDEFISEKVMFAKEVPTNNPPLYRDLERIFPDAELEAISHEEMLTSIAKEAKAVIRTGAYNPWGNIALVSGTDPFAWFENEETVVPPFYEKRIAQINQSGKKGKYYGQS